MADWHVLMIQGGPCEESAASNRDQLISLTRDALANGPTDLIVYPELGVLPYFCIVEDPRLFDWAEPIDGPTVQAFSALAREHRVNIVVPLFERGAVRGAFYDSAIVLDRQGRIIRGDLLSDGRACLAYRKVHISSHFDYLPHINEKYYFRGGAGFPVFRVDDLTLGCLICYDRSFAESWRVLALAGAQIVVVLSASYAERRARSFVSELQTAAVQNGLFCISVNKGGVETFRGNRMPFFGLSCAIDPFGEIVAEGAEGTGPQIIRAELHLARLEAHARAYHYMRDRRPEAYRSLLTDGAMDATPREESAIGAPKAGHRGVEP